ncbi:uncharacterized protein B0H18DRAFT_961469 [Fomitopsis serialis]|uniref:uncharacterized protein n=1 Tax=Fomitopsis serialis TaxID=139415 RepID=UPI002007FE3A|nr:uncharacterized protein B0H18DRAFT_961469 [Neoantrodia serialis]KAH9912006.1 hypothetical protein B0H18DRAFT_961469 [Neoantrodia serialis]
MQEGHMPASKLASGSVIGSRPTQQRTIQTGQHEVSDVLIVTCISSQAMSMTVTSYPIVIVPMCRFQTTACIGESKLIRVSGMSRPQRTGLEWDGRRLSTKVFPGLNKAKSRVLTVYDYFYTITNEFIRADTPVQDFPLPLCQIPLYRESLIKDMDLTGSYVRGERPIVPLCSMKVGFVDLLFLQPVGLQKPCRPPSPSFEGEDGCTVITVEEGLEEH